MDINDQPQREQEEIERVQGEIERVEGKIERVQVKVERVEVKVERVEAEVEQASEKTPASEDEQARVGKLEGKLSVLREEKKQLRDHEKQLWEDKRQLREAQTKLLDVRTQLRGREAELRRRANLKQQPEQEDTMLRRMEQLSLEVKDLKLRMHVPSSSTFQARGRIVQYSTSERFHLPPLLSCEEVEALWPEADWNNPTTMNTTPKKRFIQLLKTLNDNDSLPWKIAFTGAGTSVCGPNFRPDVLIYKKPKSCHHGGVVPMTTAVILELRSSSSGLYNNLYNLGKAAHYGEKMLETLGGFRSCVLVGVTDLKKVQFFKVISEQKGQFRYAIHRELSNVREVLCSLLKSSPCDLFMELPVLAMLGVEYETVDFLGCGGTSNVVLVKDGSDRSYAAKIPLSIKSLQNDHDMLSKLQAVDGVPKVLGWFDDGKSLKIYPVGRKVNYKSISGWSDMVPGLVKVLEKAHDCAIINRDVRPDNIMIAEDRLYILDWGYAVSKGQPYPFSGGVMYASERILGALERGRYGVLAEEEDDLEALVHSIFALKFKSYFHELHGIDPMHFGELREFWRKCFERVKYWGPVLEAARCKNYEKMKSEFEQMVELGFFIR